jgi:hypothetical protein
MKMNDKELIRMLADYIVYQDEYIDIQLGILATGISCFSEIRVEAMQENREKYDEMTHEIHNKLVDYIGESVEASDE